MDEYKLLFQSIQSPSTTSIAKKHIIFPKYRDSIQISIENSTDDSIELSIDNYSIDVDDVIPEGINYDCSPVVNPILNPTLPTVLPKAPSSIYKTIYMPNQLPIRQKVSKKQVKKCSICGTICRGRGNRKLCELYCISCLGKCKGKENH